MRILVLAPTYPIPINNGAKRRVFAFLHDLSRRHTVTFISMKEEINNPIREEFNEILWKEHVVRYKSPSRKEIALRSIFSRRIYREIKFSNPMYQKLVNRVLKDHSFDVIWVNFLNMAPYLELYLKECSSHPLLVLDQHNVDEHERGSLKASSENLVWRFFAALEVIKARRLQKKWFPRFDAILSVSSEDRSLTSRYVDSSSNLWLAPNGVDVDYFSPIDDCLNLPDVPKLVFGGSMDVAMNQDAVRWFVKKVLPLIRKNISKMEFWIVGRDPPKNIQRLANISGVHITGRVTDVRVYYRQADVFVVPLRFGGGTKLKTLEAMAMGLPIVSTSVGAQGLGIQDGIHLEIANSPDQFAKRVIYLLNDRKKAYLMGKAAQVFIRERYDWNKIIGNVENNLIMLKQEKMQNKKF